MLDLRRPPRTAASLVVLALAGAVGLAVTTEVPTTSERLSRASHVLPFLSLDTLERVVLTRKGASEPIVLRRADPDDRDAYYLGRDGSERADPALVHELLATLDFTRFERRLDALPPDPSPGREPLVRLELRDERGETSLEVLDETPSSTSVEPQYIVRVTTGEDKPVVGVISSRLVEALDLTPAHLRGPELFDAGIEETKSLTFVDPSGSDAVLLRLLSDELGFFASSTDGRTVRADRRWTDLTFFHLAQSTLTRLLPVDEVRQRLENASTVIEIRQEAPGATVVVRMGSRCPGDDSAFVAWRVRPRPIAGCVRGTVSPLLSPSFDRYLDRTATVLTSDEMDHVEVVWKDERLDILRDGAGFLALHADRSAVDPAAAEDFFDALSEGELSAAAEPSSPLTQLGSMTISGVAPQKALPSPLPNAEPSRRPERAFASRQVLELFASVESGAPQSNEARARGPLVHRLDDDTWWLVPPRLSWAFQADDAWAKDRQLTSFEPSEVERVVVITKLEADAPGRLHGGSTLDSDTTVERREDRFVAEGEPVDAQRMRHFLDDLAGLRAVRFETGTRSWKQNRLVVEWSTKAGEQDRLEVGRRVQGGFLARLTSIDGVFVLDVPTVSRLMLPLADRSRAQVAWRDARSIVFDFMGRTTRLVRSGRDFRIGEGAQEPDLTAALLDTLDGWNVLARSESEVHRTAPLLTIEVAVASDDQVEQAAPGSRLIRVLPRTRLLGMEAYRAEVGGESGIYYLEADAIEALFELL